MTSMSAQRPELPSRELLQRQAARLAPMRSRLLRRLGIAHRRAVLDLGAGYGAVTGELARRSGGRAVALDRHADALAQVPAETVCAEASALPFEDATFDLVFAQVVLLWNPDLAPILAEVRRVLAPGGAFLAIEPDFGGLLEHPPALALREVWLDALGRAGADPLVGRRLPAALAARGLVPRVDLMPAVAAPDPDRFTLLTGLPLTDEESARVVEARARDRALPEAQKLVHLPFVCVTV